MCRTYESTKPTMYKVTRIFRENPIYCLYELTLPYLNPLISSSNRREAREEIQNGLRCARSVLLTDSGDQVDILLVRTLSSKQDPRDVQR